MEAGGADGGRTRESCEKYFVSWWGEKMTARLLMGRPAINLAAPSGTTSCLPRLTDDEADVLHFLIGELVTEDDGGVSRCAIPANDTDDVSS